MSSASLSFEPKPTPLSPPRPPRIFAGNQRLVRVYLVNHEWKSVTAKIAVNIYLFIIAHQLFITCDPWYTYFKYLTAWGWTLIQVYFLYSLYLDLLSRSGRPISLVATMMAQAFSEVAFAVTVVVVLMFWFCIYPQEPWRNLFWEIHMHGISLLLMIFDYLYRFAGFQLRNLRFVYAFASFYTILHISTVLFSGEPIYPGMDFRNLYSFLTFLTGLTSVAITHKVFYLFHHWGRVKDDMKTVWGISEFFLIPRKNSMEVLMGDSPTSMSPGRRDRDTEKRDRDTDELPVGFTSRMKAFARREVLSIEPSEQAREMVAIRRRTK